MQRLVWPPVLVLSVFLLACNPPTSPVAKPPVVKGNVPAAVSEGSANTAASSTGDSSPASEPQTRSFTFHYRFRVKDLQPSGDAEKDLVRVWLPRPSTTDCQEVTRLEATAPTELAEHEEVRFGNRLLYFELPIPADGGFDVDIPYEVTRQEVLRAKPSSSDMEQLDDELRARLLAADKLVPTGGKALDMLDKVALKKEPLALARQLYDVVDDHVVYKKEGTGWGRGDTEWVCQSGFGNCTDFHSLFISLARSQGLPSRFEIGFSIPTDKIEGPISGYHCWAWFHVAGRGWIPVDISEADKHPELKEYYFGNLMADRVMFSVGRDLELAPKPAQEPLNFFVYPYIEVGGEPLAKEQVELQFSFKER